MSLDLIPDARTAAERSLRSSTTETVLILAVLQGIVTAIGSGLNTATVAQGSCTSANKQLVMEWLNLLGYGVTESSTDLVITW